MSDKREAIDMFAKLISSQKIINSQKFLLMILF